MRRIKLTQGKTAIVDSDDYERISTYKWFAARTTGNKLYVHSSVDGKRVSLHRFIMKAKEGQQVDHINGDTLDNRKSNLRFATRSQNLANQRRKQLPSSGYRGVYRRGDKWMAKMRLRGNDLFIGSYDSAEDASGAYKAAHKLFFKEFSPF